MEFIKHRCNKVSDIKNIEPGWGAELDLRSVVQINGEIHVGHDPWVEGDLFSTWITEWKKSQHQGNLILNTKEDGLESRLLEIMSVHRIDNFFFLDTQIPTLIRLSNSVPSEHLCIRISRYEPVSSIYQIKNKVGWAWIDCFHGEPLELQEIKNLENLKLCMVSPELQGYPLEEHGPRFLRLAHEMDAICTKNPGWWKNRL